MTSWAERAIATKYPHKRVDPGWGESYGPGPHFVTKTGAFVWMHWNDKNRCRYYNRRGEQLESEQSNVYPAMAGAIEILGWKRYRDVDDAGMVDISFLTTDRFGDLHIASMHVHVSELCPGCGVAHSMLACKDGGRLLPCFDPSLHIVDGVLTRRYPIEEAA